MADVPAWAKAALATQRREPDPSGATHTAPTRIVVGDLRIVAPLAHLPTDPRLALVLKVAEAGEFVEVLLVHPATELATDRDAVLPRRETSAPYDVVVQTDLRAVVWTWQVGERVGRLHESTLGELRAWASGIDDEAVSEQPTAGAGFHTGTRLAGPIDRRWGLKKAEGTVLRRLAGDCTEALLTRDVVWRVDPGLLRPELLELADDPEALLEELLHWVATRSLALTDDDLEFLLSVGAFDKERWAELIDVGADVLTGVLDTVIQSATGVTAGPHFEPHRLVTAVHLEPPTRAESMKVIHSIGAKEPVLP